MKSLALRAGVEGVEGTGELEPLELESLTKNPTMLEVTGKAP